MNVRESPGVADRVGTSDGSGVAVGNGEGVTVGGSVEVGLTPWSGLQAEKNKLERRGSMMCKRKNFFMDVFPKRLRPRPADYLEGCISCHLYKGSGFAL